MAVKASLVLHKDDEFNCLIRQYNPSEMHFVVIYTEGLTLQIREDALGGIIEKLQAAESEINRVAKEHIEGIRMRRYVTVTGEDNGRDADEGTPQ